MSLLLLFGGAAPDATVTAPIATGSGQALVPSVTSSSDASLAAVAGEGTGQALTPTLSISMAIPLATGTGAAPTPTASVTIAGVIAVGAGDAGAATVSTVPDINVEALTARGYGFAPIPTPLGNGPTGGGEGVGGGGTIGGGPSTPGSAGAFSLDIQGPNGGANLVTGASFKSLKVTWTVEGPGSFEIDLRESDVSDDWTPGTHRVILRGPREFAGYLTNLHREGPPKDLTYTAKGLGLSSILDWRIVRHATTLHDESSVLVDWLLNEAETQFNGNMSFEMGDVVGTTTTRSRNYCFGVVIGDAIRELASVGRGFDWEIDPDGRLNIWNITRGVDTGRVLTEDGIQEWDVELDTSELVTTVSVIGDPSQPFGPIHDMTRHLHAADTYGRHEIVIDVDSTDRDELLDAAHAELNAAGGGILRLHTMWLDDRGPWQLGDVWLQDIVNVQLPDYFGGDQDMRCTDVSITLDPLPERYFIEHTFDALVRDIEDGDPDEES